MQPLSSVGRAATERLALAAAHRGAQPDAIWHSGKLRARQTAELLWQACNPRASCSAEHGLQPGDSPRWMRDQLSGETRSILIVGHMPSLTRLLASLLGEPDGSPSVQFPQHGCVALDADGNAWREVWRIEA